MGFHISGDRKYNWYNDLSTDTREHLNLSMPTYRVIMEDMRNFSNGGKDNESGFLNRIFTNFHQEAQASVSQRLLSKEEELRELFSSPEFKGMDKKVNERYISGILAVYKKELLEKAGSYRKGKGFKFRINNENTEILRDSAEGVYYDEHIPSYLKAIFEEYARKPMYERERIYFKSTVDTLQSAISQKKAVRLTILKKIDAATGELHARKFLLAPYQILADKAGMFNYVIGYSREIAPDGTLSTEKREVSYRISRVDSLRIQESKSGFISIAAKDALDEIVAQKDVMFLSGDLIELKVRFTHKGLESFNRQLYMRPTDFKRVSDEENVYVFRCTELQALLYFFKIARDVEILSPEETRQKFILRYREAYEQYTKKN